MRVLFFNYEYPPLGGGAGNATAYILREFSKIQNLKVDLITSSTGKEYCLEKIGNNINIHRLPIGKNNENFHFQSQKELLIYAWRAYFFARKLAKENNYNLTHSFFAVPCGPLSLFLKYRKKIPYIISLRGSDVPGYSERFILVYKILTPFIRHIWKKASAVIANSLDFKKLALKTDHDCQISVITNGVDSGEFSPKVFSENDRERVGDFKIICGSRITPRKGFQSMIQAIKIFKEKGFCVKLEIIGEGNEKEDLEKLVIKLGLKSEVEFLGIIKHSDLLKYYQNANVYVSTSLNEGMSNTMLEALSAGLPVIATQTGGTDEMVKDGINGFVIKTNDPADLVAKIEKIRQDFKLEKKMSFESRRLAKKMSWNNIAREYYALYNKVADE
ncbi:glycosyltransferase family 4 protein [bacterium]|nr:glycosyltransferase family 4 protein [bacterium]